MTVANEDSHDALRESSLREIEDGLRRAGIADFQVLDWTEILWSGWEGDSSAALVRIPGQGPKVSVYAHIGSGRSPEAMLRERLVAYEDAIRDTRRLIAMLDIERQHAAAFPDPIKTMADMFCVLGGKPSESYPAGHNLNLLRVSVEHAIDVGSKDAGTISKAAFDRALALDEPLRELEEKFAREPWS